MDQTSFSWKHAKKRKENRVLMQVFIWFRKINSNPDPVRTWKHTWMSLTNTKKQSSSLAELAEWPHALRFFSAVLLLAVKLRVFISNLWFSRWTFKTLYTKQYTDSRCRCYSIVSSRIIRSFIGCELRLFSAASLSYFRHTLFKTKSLKTLWPLSWK